MFSDVMTAINLKLKMEKLCSWKKGQDSSIYICIPIEDGNIVTFLLKDSKHTLLSLDCTVAYKKSNLTYSFFTDNVKLLNYCYCLRIKSSHEPQWCLKKYHHIIMNDNQKLICEKEKNPWP